MPGVLAIADDLSGAVESAAALIGSSGGDGSMPQGSLVYCGVPATIDCRADVVVIDLDTRRADSRGLAGTLLSALDHAGETQRIYKKVDSLLRGNTGLELRVLSRRRRVVIAPALPHLSRVVVDGVLHTVSASHALRDVLPEGVLVPLSDVHRGPAALASIIDQQCGPGVPLLVDARTDADLDLIAEAGLALDDVVLAGSGGLAAAVGRRRSGDAISSARRRPTLRDSSRVSAPVRRIVALIGTTEEGVEAQLAHLESNGIRVSRSGDAPIGTSWTHRGDEDAVVLAVDPRVPMDPQVPAMSSTVLARSAAPSLEDHDLVLSGGETARRVLDALGETYLSPVREVHRGAVMSIASSGRLVVTRPGSFGDYTSLLAMIEAVREFRADKRISPLHHERTPTNRE